MTTLKIGVDVGGTFTDVVGLGDDGRVWFSKTPSTPEDQSIGVLNGINALLKQLGIGPEHVENVAHGTTVATNTLLERNGAKTALITTEGFRDVLQIGRQSRTELYDLHARKPDALIPRNLRCEAKERTLYDGSIACNLDKEDLRMTVQELKKRGIESIAVCFLHSYANAQNEKEALSMIREVAPDLPVSISSEVLPEFREFERMNTTVLNAYVQPRMQHYISQLRGRLNENFVKAPLTIMQSSGGMMTDQVAASKSVNTLLSGPAGGVLAAEYISKISPYKNIITGDLGGTSFDVAVIHNGEVGVTGEGTIEGFPVKFPHIDITTIGAGGGSIAWIDTGGALRVGPKSAGAVPGPVCYSKGGTEPAVTDAHAVLGRVGSRLLGGAMQLDIQAAQKAIKEKLADRLNMNVEEVAEGILRVAESNMVRAIRVMTVERGIDPRKFALMPYGGAGPLHAAEIARALGISTVIVPVAPGNFSAFGLVVAPVRYDESATYHRHQKDVKLNEVERIFQRLENSALKEISRDHLSEKDMVFQRKVDIRYYGQAYELTINVTSAEFDETAWSNLIKDFAALHQKSFGFAKQDPVELVALRLSVIGKTNHERSHSGELGDKKKETDNLEYRKVYFSGKWIDTAVFQRDDLAIGASLEGPAIIEEHGSTTVVGVEDEAEIDENRNIIIHIASKNSGNAITNSEN